MTIRIRTLRLINRKIMTLKINNIKIITKALNITYKYCL